MKKNPSRFILTKPVQRKEWLMAGARLGMAITAAALIVDSFMVKKAAASLNAFPLNLLSMLVLAVLAFLVILDIRELVTHTGRRLEVVGQVLATAGLLLFIGFRAAGNNLWSGVGACLFLIGALVELVSQFLKSGGATE